VKILFSFILSFIFLVFWSCSDAGDPLSNDCTEGLDCAGECGGTATIDVCGECDGSGLNSDDCCGDSSSCVHYSTEIQPIFDANCTPCHITSTRNNLSLSNYTNIMSGNSTNGPVIVSGDHANSLLWQKVNSGSMPPSGQLTSDQINLIVTWIDEGALDN
jgi:hypothetical protein